MITKREFETLKTLIDKKDHEKCLALALKLCEEFPTLPSINFAIGLCLVELGKSEDAVIHLEMAVHYFSLTSNHTEEDLSLFIGLATLLMRTGKTANVSQFISKNYKKIRWDSDSTKLITELVQVCLIIESPELGLEIINEAFPVYNGTDNVIQILMLLANTSHAADNKELEFEAYTRALELDPLNPLIHNRLSRFLGRIKEWGLAADHIKFLRNLNPEFESKSIAQDFFNLSKNGSFEEQEAVRKKWLSSQDNEQESRAPFAALLATDDGQFLLDEASKFAKWTTLIVNKPRRIDRNPPPKKNSNKIRIGYVSPDYRNHAVCHLVKDLIGTHNRKEFEVFGYGISMNDNSEDRSQIISKFDHFHPLENSKTTEILHQIHSDSLDIVIDLAGYTQGFIQTLFNRINGPLIVNYLGYPGTTGHPQYDYIIGDSIVIPEKNERFYSEKVVRLDCCYQPNSPSRKVAKVDFSQTDLPKDSFIFCNFNTRQKINRETLCEWQKIVLACPDSVLWLLDPGPNARTEVLKVLNQIQSRVFFAPFADMPWHLGRIKHANLFLDSFPYGAHTTASDAIFSGVPILARSGEGFQSRVSHSIVHHAGLPEMFAATWEEFNQKAIDFYQTYDRKRRQKIENILLDKDRDKHPYNINWTTRQIENAYAAMLAH